MYRGVVHGAGRVVAVGTYGHVSIFAASADGRGWNQTRKKSGSRVDTRGVGFGAGTFVAVGGDPVAAGSSKPVVLLSKDGVDWSDFTPISGRSILRRLAWGNDRFVAVGDRGRRSTSADGRTWQDAPDVRAIDTLVDVAFGDGVFAGVGLHSLRMTSRDGLTWSERQVGEEGEHLNAIVWAGDRFVAVGIGATYVSPDGAAWKRYPNTNAPLVMAWGDGVFVGANWKGRLLRSTDAVAWEPTFKCEHHVEALAYGG